MKEVDASFQTEVQMYRTVFLLSVVNSALLQCVMVYQKTYCAGERYINIAEYESGTERSDNQSWEGGYDGDTYRWTSTAPLYDINTAPITMLLTRTLAVRTSRVFNMAFCDGSTRLISYEVDPRAHSVSGNRSDGQMYYSGGVGATYSLPE